MASFRKRSCYIRHFTFDMSNQIAPCLRMTCCILHFAIWLNNRLAFCIVEKHSACLLHFELVSGPACLTQMLALGLAILIAWMALLGGVGLATQMLALFWQRVRVGFSMHVSSNPCQVTCGAAVYWPAVAVEGLAIPSTTCSREPRTVVTLFFPHAPRLRE